MTNSTPQKGDTIVVWFSCGAASAVAAQRTIEKYGNFCTIRVVNNPVKEEDDDNRRFLRDVEKWLGINIEKKMFYLFLLTIQLQNKLVSTCWKKQTFCCPEFTKWATPTQTASDA
jgi:hypothetical protein